MPPTREQLRDRLRSMIEAKSQTRGPGYQTHGIKNDSHHLRHTKELTEAFNKHMQFCEETGLVCDNSIINARLNK